jgi:hypothetical protein
LRPTLHLEKLLQQHGRGSREHDLRAVGVHRDIDYHRSNTVTLAVALVTHLVAAGDDSLGVTEFYDQRATVHSFDDAVDHVADAVGVILVDYRSLGFAHPLE